RDFHVTGVQTCALPIYLGHDRSVQDVVDTAIQEDVQGIAVSSYQGGHVEYFTYMVDLLRERGAGHIRVYGGGGGVIVPEEIAQLEAYGVAKIFSPDDGMRLGLEGMIEQMIRECDFDPLAAAGGEDARRSGGEGDTLVAIPAKTEAKAVARALTAVEQQAGEGPGGDGAGRPRDTDAPVLGITGTGGAGKSTLTDE